MKRFFLTLFLFLLPLFFLAPLPLAILFFSGEFTPFEEIVTLQQQEAPVLFGKAYITTVPSSVFKLRAVRERIPRVITFGTSRVLQFRSGFFKKPSEFYNSGGAGGTIFDLQKALTDIPKGAEPDIIILGLDQHNFSTQWYKNNAEQKESMVNLRTLIVLAVRHIYQDALHKKFSFGDIVKKRGEKTRFIGIIAMIQGDGIRNDGSYRYGKFLSDPYNSAHEDYQFKDTLERVQRGNRLFFRDTYVSEDAMKELNVFLTQAKERGIHVVGFLPPFAEVVADALHADPGYDYLFQIGATIAPYFMDKGFTFYDFMDPRTFGGNDAEMIDGFHGSERTMAKMLLQMIKTDKQLAAYLNTLFLEEKLKEHANNFEIVGDQVIL